MQDARKRLIFDTSGLNALADDAESNHLAKSLGIGFQVRISETSLSEIGACSRAERRGQLLALCRHLVHAGECIRPYNWIIGELTKSHASNPARFDWKALDIRGRELEDELTRPEFLGTDGLAEETSADFEAKSEDFEAVYRDARPIFDAIVEGRERERPPISEFITALKADSGSLWHLCGGVYSRGCGKEMDIPAMRVFVDACPPFNAMMLGLCVALFDRCVRHVRARADYRAGWLDLLAGAYLPYCDRFITNDGGQRNSLAVVAAEADLATTICTFAEFKRGLTVLV
jgi:hypothetical protein